MNTIKRSYFSNLHINNLLIYLGISFFVTLSFFFISFYSVNVIFWDEWEYVDVISSAYDGEKFWEIPQFHQHNVHRPIFPTLIMIADALLFSWDVTYEMFFGWLMLIGTITFFYFLIKENNNKLKWLLVPISAILFNPLQYENLLWGFTSITWFLTTFSLVASIYFLNSKKKNSLTLAITFGIIASFSTGIGLFIWPIGAISLFRKIKSLIVWLSCMAVIFFVYTINFNFGLGDLRETSAQTFLDVDVYEYMLVFLSNWFPTNFYLLQLLIGLSILGGILIGIIFALKISRKRKIFVPWIQFGLIGLFSAIVTAGFRSTTLVTPVESRYIALSNFSFISLVVIVPIIILGFQYGYNNPKKRRLVLGVLFAFFIVLGIGLGSSYYHGWIKGSEWHELRTSNLKCITNPFFEFKCPYISYKAWELPERAIQLKERGLGPFN